MATVKKEKHDPYPWSKWFKRNRFTLNRGKGKDFTCQTHGMVAQIRTAARKYLPKRATVSIEVVEDTIVVTVVK